MYWRIIKGSNFTKNVIVNDKVIIVTVCNSRIGKATVLELASRGARVYMACRDPKKCKQAKQEIIIATGNNNIFHYVLDLSSLESIIAFVKKFFENENRLDVLINNDSIMPDIGCTTMDYFEVKMSKNHLAHFLLTNLLLYKLQLSAPSKIVVVSNRLHSGIVKIEFLPDSQIVRKILLAPWSIFTKSPVGGTQPTLTCALDPNLEEKSRKYFDKCKISKDHNRLNDREIAEWLCNVNEELKKLDLDEIGY